MLAIEATIGLALGLAIRLIAIALQLAGSIAAQSTALAQIFGAGATPDPMPAIGNILMLGRHHAGGRLGAARQGGARHGPLLRILPMGLPLPAADLAAWGTARVAQAFALGFSLAAPFVIAAFAYNLALGAINRAMPQLMVAFVGAPAITAGGLLILMLASPVILHFWAAARRRARRPAGAAAMSEDGGEKVFDPTPQRLAEARRKGDIPRSADVTAAATYLALLAVVGTVGAYAVTQAASVLMIFVAQPDRLAGRILGPGGPGLSGAILAEALAALAPVFLVPIAAVLVSLFAQQAITFSGDKLQPKLSRLSPLANAKRKFGAAGLVEFAKATVKLAAVATALFLYLVPRPRPDDRRRHRRGQGARRHANAVAGGAAHAHLPDRRRDRRGRPRLAALRPRPAAAHVLPGAA